MCLPPPPPPRPVGSLRDSVVAHVVENMEDEGLNI